MKGSRNESFSDSADCEKRVCRLCIHPLLSILRSAGGGLASVYMSWSAAEYLYMLLLMNGTLLPPQALFIIRYQKVAFYPPWGSACQPQHCLNCCPAFASCTSTAGLLCLDPCTISCIFGTKVPACHCISGMLRPQKTTLECGSTNPWMAVCLTLTTGPGTFLLSSWYFPAK